MKILVVDDEYSVVESLREYLTLRGFEVLGAARGEEALEVISKEHPDLMLLDLKMPGMSGFEVLAKAKAKEPNIKVIIVTGLDDVDLRKNAMTAGAIGFAFKPVDVQGLERIITVAIGKPPPLAPKSPMKASQVNVLVVDDEPEIAVSLRYYLVGLGYKVQIAANGEEALKMLKDRDRPSIMLLDLTMPQKGGFSVLEEMKRLGIHIPVIILTGADPELVKQATKLLGASKFLQKPVLLPIVERTIRELVMGVVAS